MEIKIKGVIDIINKEYGWLATLSYAYFDDDILSFYYEIGDNEGQHAIILEESGLDYLYNSLVEFIKKVSSEK